MIAPRSSRGKKSSGVETKRTNRIGTRVPATAVTVTNHYAKRVRCLVDLLGRVLRVVLNGPLLRTHLRLRPMANP